MDFAVRYEGYIFAGVVRYSIAIARTDISGGVTEQKAGGWTWFLRYADGQRAGHGIAWSWAEMESDIQRTLGMEAEHGRISYPRRDRSR